MNAFLRSWNQVAERLAALAGPWFVQSAVLVLVLLVLERLLRHRLRPAYRHALWLLVPLKLLLPPSLALPASPAYWLPRAVSPLASTTHRQAEVSTPRPPSKIDHPAEPGPSTAKSRAVPAETTPRPEFLATPAVRLTIPGGLLLGWVTGVLGLLVWLTRRTVSLHRLTTLATVAPPHLHAALDQARSRLRLRRRVDLRLVGDGHSPALCGLRNPVVLLPRGLASRLGPEGLQAVLLHEVAHARRADLWVNALQTLLQVVWWWHPLVWVANARLRAAREECVDDTVAYELGPDDESYPAALLEVAKSALARPALSLGLVGIVESRSALRGRIERLLESPPAHPPRLGRWGILAVTVTGLLLLPMARSTPDPDLAAPPAAPTPVSSADDAPTARLAAAEARLTELLTRYADQHPFVVEQLRRITELRGQQLGPVSPAPDPWLDTLPGRVRAPDGLRELRLRLGDLQLQYSTGSPFVQALEQRIADLEGQAAIAYADKIPVEPTRVLARRAAENPEPTKPRVLVQTRLLSIPSESLGALGLRLATNPPTAAAEGGVQLILEGTGTNRVGAGQLPAFLAALAQRPEIETLTPPADTPLVPGQWVHQTLISSDTNHPFSLQLDFGPQPTAGPRTLAFTAVATSTEFVDLRKGTTDHPTAGDPAAGTSADSTTFAVNAVGYVNRTRTNTVELGHGETVVLAGPAIPETVHTVDKVAGLGDLPVLGRLFRTEATFTRTRWEVALVTATWMDESR